MAGKQLLISKLLINPFGTSIIDQRVRESIKLVGQSDSISTVIFSTRFQRARGCNYGIPRLSQNTMKRLQTKEQINYDI